MKVSKFKVGPVAEAVPFDVDSLTADSSDLIGLTNTQEVGTALANRNFGKEYEYEFLSTFSTTSAGYVTALSFSGTKPAGTYRIAFSYETTNSKANTNNNSQVLFNGVSQFLRVQSGDVANSVGGFQGDLVHAGGTLTVLIQIQRTSGNGNAILNSLRLELWRQS